MIKTFIANLQCSKHKSEKILKILKYEFICLDFESVNLNTDNEEVQIFLLTKEKLNLNSQIPTYLKGFIDGILQIMNG